MAKKRNEGDRPNKDGLGRERFEFVINAYDAYDPRGIRTSKYMRFIGEYFANSEHEARRMCILHMHTLSRFVKDLELNAV